MNKTDREKLRKFKAEVERLADQYQEAVDTLKEKTPEYTSGNYAIGFFAGKRSAYPLLLQEFTKRGLA